jgi:hypothetical protein
MFSGALALVAVALLPLLSQGQDQSQRDFAAKYARDDPSLVR